jgi:hypothetical protein
MEAQGVDMCLDLGDILELLTETPSTMLGQMRTADLNFTGDWHYVLGNHEIHIWEANFTNYVAIIPQTPPGMLNYWTEGEGKPSGYPDTTAYSFDKCGVHCVVLGTKYEWESDVQTALRVWLIADLAATTLPIIAFTHFHLDDTRGASSSYYPDFAAIQDIFEAYNVQAVIAGHQHQVPYKSDFVNVINGIPYYHLRGNCSGPMDGSTPDTDNGEDAAFYIFEIVPNAYYEGGRWKANIKVTCLYTAKETENQTDAMDRECVKFSMGV